MWDVPENIQRVKERVEYVLSGCKCKTGCGTRRCKCRKSGRSCGPGCHCHGCVNVPNSNGDPETDDLEDTVAVDVMRAESEQQEYMNESDEDSDDVEEDNDSETEQIMTSVFGGDTSDDDESN